MPKLYSSQQIVRALEREGFAFVSQRGSHVKYRKTDAGVIFTVIVPASRKQVPAAPSAQSCASPGWTRALSDETKTRGLNFVQHRLCDVGSGEVGCLAAVRPYKCVVRVVGEADCLSVPVIRRMSIWRHLNYALHSNGFVTSSSISAGADVRSCVMHSNWT